MPVTATYIEHPAARHCGDYYLVCQAEDGEILRTFSTRTTPRAVSLRECATRWAREHGHTLKIDWSSLAA